MVCTPLRRYALRTRRDDGTEQHTRQVPCSTVTPGLVRYVTEPDLTATAQVPQLPARQPASMEMPLAAARSRTVPSSGRQASVRPRALEHDLDRRGRGRPGGRGTGRRDFLNRRRPERLVVYVGCRHAPLFQRRHDRRHHHRRAADVELEVVRRQDRSDDVDREVAGLLEVAALDVVRPRLAVGDVLAEPGKFLGEPRQLLPERVLPSAAKTEKEVRVGGGMLERRQSVEHREQRRHANPAADEHRRTDVGAQAEIARRRAHVQDVALLDVVVEERGTHPRRRGRVSRRRQLPLDRDPVALGPHHVRQRIAADHRFRASGHGQLKRQVLARPKRRQPAPVVRREHEGADAVALRDPARDDELPPARPRGVVGDRLGSLARGLDAPRQEIGFESAAPASLEPAAEAVDRQPAGLCRRGRRHDRSTDQEGVCHRVSLTPPALERCRPRALLGAQILRYSKLRARLEAIS